MVKCPKCKTTNPKTNFYGFCTIVTFCNEIVKTYLFGLIKIKCKQILLHELENEELENNYMKTLIEDFNSHPEWCSRLESLETYKNFTLGQKIKHHRDEAYIIHIGIESNNDVFVRLKLENGASVTGLVDNLEHIKDNPVPSLDRISIGSMFPTDSTLLLDNKEYFIESPAWNLLNILKQATSHEELVSKIIEFIHEEYDDNLITKNFVELCRQMIYLVGNNSKEKSYAIKTINEEFYKLQNGVETNKEQPKTRFLVNYETNECCYENHYTQKHSKIVNMTDNELNVFVSKLQNPKVTYLG